MWILSDLSLSPAAPMHGRVAVAAAGIILLLPVLCSSASITSSTQDSGEKEEGTHVLTSKSRNARNRATYELWLAQKMRQVYQSPLRSSALMKRGEGPQLSVVSPLDVLRQQLMYELARRRIKENRKQIEDNERILKTLGKRSVDPTDDMRLDSRPIYPISRFR